jgi:hypothetical protein
MPEIAGLDGQNFLLKLGPALDKSNLHRAGAIGRLEDERQAYVTKIPN